LRSKLVCVTVMSVFLTAIEVQVSYVTLIRQYVQGAILSDASDKLRVLFSKEMNSSISAY
jgi:hypothetical protein